MIESILWEHMEEQRRDLVASYIGDSIRLAGQGKGFTNSLSDMLKDMRGHYTEDAEEKTAEEVVESLKAGGLKIVRS